MLCAGEGRDGLSCVRFGMVTEDTDLQELLALVLNTGKEIESSSKFIEQMTQVVKKGIETATEDLKRENDERLWQEGLLRHVPLVGSVYNWLSPPPQQGVRGRTLDLNAGVLESTENTYKYHMQCFSKWSVRPPGGVEEMQGGGRRVRLEWGSYITV
ncbi:hypothetical protein FHG87_025024 [Trinorchestia longiramus]|nr:hypothetical protein FHG87_025024 [Trinorchestia longiramus]